MTTTTTLERQADDAIHAAPIAALAPADRLALALGTQLILWSERRRQVGADRATRAEEARISHAAARAVTAPSGTFEHRSRSGPTR